MSATVVMRRLASHLDLDDVQKEIVVRNRLLGEANQTASAGLSLNSSIVHNFYATSTFGLGSKHPTYSATI